MSVKVGISPISWQNDDLPDLTADFTMDQALEEAREIGYLGVERGRRMPAETEALRDYLAQYDLALCGGWCSGNLLVNDVATERRAIAQQVQQFAALEAPCIVYAECSITVQGDIDTPVNARPKLSRDEIKGYAQKLGEVAKWTADQGVALSYHHHMGSIIEGPDDVNWLMEFAPTEVHLLFDTGHLLFGGGDILEILSHWHERVNHVHFKDIRPDIVQKVRDDNLSFLQGVIAGAFTVPGDGAIDFQAVADKLKAVEYKGWIVVEAEQDPKLANPCKYSKLGYDHILNVCDRAGLQIITRT